MNTDDPNTVELEQVEAEARALLDANLQDRGLLDLDDVLERASAPLAPGATYPGSSAMADILPFAAQPTTSGPLPEQGQLDAINAELRALLDADLSRPWSLEVEARSRPRRRRRVGGWIAAASVSLALLTAGGSAAAHERASQRWLETQAMFSAQMQLQRDRAQQRQAQLALARQPAEAPASEAVEQPEPEPAQALEPAQAPEPAIETKNPTGAKRKRASQNELAKLDAQAYALLRAGQSRRAREVFMEIAARGGRTEYAELAYGELFALAGQANRAGELARLWRRYLRTFPKGRYADGARAGLCRRREGEARSQCWRDYLDEHPHGAARTQAQAEATPTPAP